MFRQEIFFCIFVATRGQGLPGGSGFEATTLLPPASCHGNEPLFTLFSIVPNLLARKNYGLMKVFFNSSTIRKPPKEDFKAVNHSTDLFKINILP